MIDVCLECREDPETTRDLSGEAMTCSRDRQAHEPDEKDSGASRGGRFQPYEDHMPHFITTSTGSNCLEDQVGKGGATQPH